MGWIRTNDLAYLMPLGLRLLSPSELPNQFVWNGASSRHTRCYYAPHQRSYRPCTRHACSVTWSAGFPRTKCNYHWISDTGETKISKGKGRLVLTLSFLIQVRPRNFILVYYSRCFPCPVPHKGGFDMSRGPLLSFFWLNLSMTFFANILILFQFSK